MRVSMQDAGWNFEFWLVVAQSSITVWEIVSKRTGFEVAEIDLILNPNDEEDNAHNNGISWGTPPIPLKQNVKWKTLFAH